MIPYEHISGAWGRAIVYGLCHSKNAFNLIETCQSCGALIYLSCKVSSFVVKNYLMGFLRIGFYVFI